MTKGSPKIISSKGCHIYLDQHSVIDFSVHIFIVHLYLVSNRLCDDIFSFIIDIIAERKISNHEKSYK